jgi:P-type E1-E2 ATPase
VIVVTILIVLSSLIRFWQEYRSNIAAEELKSLVKTTATVLRSDAGRTEIDIKEIVPGDIIYSLREILIPADCRVLQSKDLFVSQSILTGEAMPVREKGPGGNQRKYQIAPGAGKYLLHGYQYQKAAPRPRLLLRPVVIPISAL